MNLRDLQQKHAGYCDQQQVIVNGAVNEGRPMTPEETTAFNSLQTQIDGLTQTITAALKMEARARELDEPMNKPSRPPVDDGMAGSDRTQDKLEDGGFANVGEFLHCVKYGDTKGRLNQFKADISTTDVGVMIPPAFSQQIMMLQPESEIVMPRAMVIPAGDPPDAEFVIPYFRQGASGALGGVALTWTAEGADMTGINDPDLPDMRLLPKEISGMATINNKTLNNWSAAGDFLTNLLRQAWVTGRDFKFLRGSGAGVPLGILNPNAKGVIQVKRKDANKVQYVDIINMLSKLYPESLANAIWVTTITNLPQIATLQNPLGQYIFILDNATQGLSGRLMGIPIRFTGKIPTVGTAGDLVLADFSKYLIKNGSGPFVAISEHVKFTSNKTVFKIVANIDGQPWVNEPLTLEDGTSQVSPYVTLQ
jgi:HK97 family phage major capsid protein